MTDDDDLGTGYHGPKDRDHRDWVHSEKAGMVCSACRKPRLAPGFTGAVRYWCHCGLPSMVPDEPKPKFGNCFCAEGAETECTWKVCPRRPPAFEEQGKW